MRRYLFLGIILLVLTSNNLFSQNLREDEFSCYTRVEGLSNNFISGIVQDSTGYIWIGTNRGLNRFDGRFFTNYYTGSADLPLPDNMIKHLRIQGQEIIGSTIMGSFVYNTNSRKGIQLIIPSDSLIFGWTNNITETIRDGRGDYVLSSHTGLYAFDSKGNIINRFDRFKPSDARSEELIFGGGLTTIGNGLILQENDIFFSAYDPVRNKIDTFYGARYPEFKNAISDINGQFGITFPGEKNKLFILNLKKNSLDIFDIDNNRLYGSRLSFDISTELDGSSKLYYLSDTLLAITCKVSGFYLFDYHPATHQLSLHNSKYFDGRHCTTVFLDREKRFWVGTNNGLYKQNLTNSFYHAYDLTEQSPDLRNCDIRAILAYDTKLFVGFRNKGGLMMLDKFSHKIEHRFEFEKLGPDFNSINHIFHYGGDTLWIGTLSGILWLDIRNFHYGPLLFPKDLAWANGIRSSFFMDDRQGNIWIALAKINTVIRFNRNTRAFTDISGPKSPLLKITYCFTMGMDNQGNVWFAGDGLCRWNVAKQKIDTLISYSISAKMLSSYIFILGLDNNNNNLWMYSFNNGIIQYNCTENKTYLRKGENNFWDGNILTASPVIQDHIWLGMDNGISVFDIRDYSSQLFTYADGLPSMPITSIRKGSCYDTDQNIFYFGSGHQLISFKPDSSFSHPSPPDLFIDEINTPAGIFRGNTKNLTLSSSDNSAQIDFNAVNFRSPEDNRFAYRVDPSSDTSWKILNWQHIVNFNNLSPGKYRIQLKLFSANNRWPEQVKQIILTVNPPYWETGWFIAILVLIGVTATIFIYRYRIRQIHEKINLNQQMADYEMKALHAQMNPHFIFNALNSIKEMILYEDTKNASRYLSRFAELIRLNLEYSMKTFITLRQNIEYLERYLEMEQLRFADFSFQFTIKDNLNADEVRIAPMMLQPLVENAIWHGLLPSDRDKRLDILFYLDGNKLACEIEDNGIGLQQSTQMKNGLPLMHESVGIDNIRKRIVIFNEKYGIHCTLSIFDKKEIPGSDQPGTIARLVVPQFSDDLTIHKSLQ